MARRRPSLRYESNPKHKLPWQPGRKGSLCPPEFEAAEAKRLLRTSVQHGTKRFATDGQTAYCAQEHRPGYWHGYPVGWREVPATVRNDWIRDGTITRAVARRNW